MDSCSIASRIKTKPRVLAIRSSSQLQDRLASMKSHEIWIAMSQRGLAGWKHKIMSDELHTRKQKLFVSTSWSPFLEELSP
jgi:hypothetical protein